MVNQMSKLDRYILCKGVQKSLYLSTSGKIAHNAVYYIIPYYNQLKKEAYLFLTIISRVNAKKERIKKGVCSQKNFPLCAVGSKARVHRVSIR